MIIKRIFLMCVVSMLFIWNSFVSAFDKAKVELIGDKISEVLKKNEQSLTDKFIVLVEDKINDLRSRIEYVDKFATDYYDKDFFEGMNKKINTLNHLLDYLYQK